MGTGRRHHTRVHQAALGGVEPLRFALVPFPMVAANGQMFDIPLAEPVTDEAADAKAAEGRERRERVLLAMHAGKQTLRDIAVHAFNDIRKRDTVGRVLDELARAGIVGKNPVSGHYAMTPAGQKAAVQLAAQAAAAYRKASDGA